MARRFKDRRDAGAALEEALPDYPEGETVVVALPRGGLPVAAEICRARNLPLALVFVRKIGMPGHPELAIGAIAEAQDVEVYAASHIAARAGLDDDEIRRMGNALLPEIARRRTLYLGDRPVPDLKGKTLVVVDDGAATGATLKASLMALRQSKPDRIVVALPVAPEETVAALKDLADEVVCLSTPSPFVAVGAHFDTFYQVGDDEVIRLIKEYAVP
ncbi:MAG: phosphoribosyltransferase family protein [Pseudomonadota bacterium]